MVLLYGVTVGSYCIVLQYGLQYCMVLLYGLTA